MSANNPTPLFTLVRTETLEDSEGLDYTTGSSEAGFHDEIKLIDGNGEPCAIPSAQGVEDLDYEYEYIDGSRGGINRVLRQKITLKCDFLTGETRRKLHQWKQDRAKVRFTPGYGSKTECAWRPVPDAATHDLTGRYEKSEVNSDTEAHYVWDDYLMDGKMRVFENDASRQIKTSAGTMQMFSDGSGTNHANPATPVSDGSGWSVADGYPMTGTYIEDGFGCTGCPDSWRYDFASTSSNGYLYYPIPTGMTFDSDSTVCITVWLKGNLSSLARMRLRATPDDYVDADIGEMDLSSWTPIHLTLNTDWTVATDRHILIYSHSADAVGALEVGPIIITDSASNYTEPFPQWSETGEAPATERIKLTDVEYPDSGTQTASFWLSDRVSDLRIAAFDVSSRGDGGGMYIVNTGSAESASLAWNDGTANQSQSFDYDLLNFGGVNVASVVYSTKDIKYYINGTYIGEDSAEFGDLGVDDLDIGSATSYGGSGIHGLLTFRLDREKLTADEVADLHKQLTDPGSLEVIVPARGRVFRIDSIPSTPRATSGGTHWIGTLVLEQVDYDSRREDLTSKEY